MVVKVCPSHPAMASKTSDIVWLIHFSHKLVQQLHSRYAMVNRGLEEEEGGREIGGGAAIAKRNGDC